jgi:hypothetical protein
VIFREFDGLRLGIKNHDAILPACRLHRRAALPVPRLSVSACYFDLQIIQGSLQVKTPAACAILRISLGFKQLAHGLHDGLWRA